MSFPEETMATCVPAVSSWRERLSAWQLPSAHAKILSGSITMLIGSIFVSLANFGYNIGVARMLGPSDFSYAAAAITILMLVSAITLSFQLVCAKLVAKAPDAGHKAGVYQSLRRRSWIVGLSLGATLIVFRSVLSDYLQLSSSTLIVILAVGLAVYVPLGVKRGGLQGTCRFRSLAVSMGAEAVVKFLGAILLVALGYGVLGAVAAISLSVLVAYALPDAARELRGSASKIGSPHIGETMQAIVFFVGQVIIVNIDILMVKHFFPPQEAGLYAAIALVGRLLYFGTWSITSAMFPVSAGSGEEAHPSAMLAVPLVMVTAMSAVFVLMLMAFPQFVFRSLFGAHFSTAVQGLDWLLTMNAAASGVYAISVVLITYEMSRRIANTGWLQLVVSGLIVLGVTWFHSSLLQVILVQQVLRVLLLLAVSYPFVRSWATAGRGLHAEITARH